MWKLIDSKIGHHHVVTTESIKLEGGQVIRTTIVGRFSDRTAAIHQLFVPEYEVVNKNVMPPETSA